MMPNWMAKRPLVTAAIELKALLIAKGIAQIDVVRKLRGRGNFISQKGFNDLVNGKSGCSAKWFNEILRAVPCTEAEKYRLNEFAARDMGWEIGFLHRATRKPPGMMDPRIVRTRVGRAKVRAPGYKIGSLKVSYGKMNGGVVVRTTASGFEDLPVYPEQGDDDGSV